VPVTLASANAEAAPVILAQDCIEDGAYAEADELLAQVLALDLRYLDAHALLVERHLSSWRPLGRRVGTARSPRPDSPRSRHDTGSHLGEDDDEEAGGGRPMSEYQCYEFVALERALTAKQMAELRVISTRAEISPTRFWNEYQWGNLKADPRKLMERYFDAHLYFANWGTHRLMLRIPKARVDLTQLSEYFAGAQERLTVADKHVVIDLACDTEDCEYNEENRGTLAALSPIRAELIGGDLRPAYLAWLLSAQADDLAADATEPPVPLGLGELTAAQRAMIDFLRIDIDLVAAAAMTSARTMDDRQPLFRWVAAMSEKEKDVWLRRAIEEPELALGTELLRAYLATKKPDSAPERRTVGALRRKAETQRAIREKAEVVRAKRARAAAEAARERQLEKLARDVDGAWAKLEGLVESSKYDDALKLAAELRDLALRAPDQTTFASRFAALRKRQHRRRGFFDRWKRADRW
jgi:hypothetical protein